MEASYRTRTSYSASNDAVSQPKSTNIGKYLLLAVGIIILVGSIIATGCLYSRLSYSSFAIGGTGLILGPFCILLSICYSKDIISNSDLKHSQLENKSSNNTYSHNTITSTINEVKPLNVIVQNIHASENSIRNRLPCKHEGGSCFANSVLQIMAHLTDFRNLFDKDHHKLEKGCLETDACLSKRQRVQETGNELIKCILEGKQAENLGQFIDIVNDAMEAMGLLNTYRQPLKNIQAGGDPDQLMSYIETILIPNGITYGFTFSFLNQLDQVSEDLIQNKDIPPIIVFESDGSCPDHFHSEIVLNDIGTYRLAAVRISTGHHSIPIICSQSGKYFKLDDVVGRAEEISKEELSNILTNYKQSPHAYYVKKNLH